jgi:hypothetical protein
MFLTWDISLASAVEENKREKKNHNKIWRLRRDDEWMG